MTGVRIYDPSQSGRVYVHIGMPETRVPITWGQACRYCDRYRRPCGRHES